MKLIKLSIFIPPKKCLLYSYRHNFYSISYLHCLLNSHRDAWCISTNFCRRSLLVDPISYSKSVVKMVEYHINEFPILRDIIDASGPKGKYGGCLKGSIAGFSPLNNFAYLFINLGFTFICCFFQSFGVYS